MKTFSNFICAIGILFFLQNTFAIDIFAQEDVKTAKISGGVGYFMPGVSFLNINKLNTTLQNKGYPKFPSSFSSFGGAGQAYISNFIIGGEGHGLIGKEQTNDKITMNLSAGYGLFNVGYVLYSTGGLLIYPLFGLGGSGLSLSLTDRYIPKFDDVLDSLKGHVELSTGSFILHFAIGTEYLITFDKGEKSRGGIVIGVRAGILFTPVAGDWKMDDYKVIGGPETGVTGFYIRLLIGGGGIQRK